MKLPKQKNSTTLDIRSCNTDRHLGNISSQLDPIDHGCIATRAFRDPADLCWIHWKESNQPFSNEMKSKIAAIDWKKDEQEILNSTPNINPERLATLKYSTLLLKKGTLAGLTPFEMGSFIEGHAFGASVMRTMYEKAEEYEKAKERPNLDEAMNQMMDQSIQFLKTNLRPKRPNRIQQVFLKCLPFVKTEESDLAYSETRKEKIRASLVAFLDDQF